MLCVASPLGGRYVKEVSVGFMRNEEVFAAESIKKYHEMNGSSIVKYCEPLQDSAGYYDEC
uniref:hypothetical protein n=1 Tax=Vibrio cholerae TaxID=666 RepID=UPI003F583496